MSLCMWAQAIVQVYYSYQHFKMFIFDFNTTFYFMDDALIGNHFQFRCTCDNANKDILFYSVAPSRTDVGKMQSNKTRFILVLTTNENC